MSPGFRFVGFLTRKVAGRPEWLDAVANIVDIASVSGCISRLPLDRWDWWLHNHAGFYNDPETAWKIVPEDERDSYELFAYRVFLAVFGESGRQDGFPFDTAGCGVAPCADEPDLSGFERLGFDVVSWTYGAFLECSPLSCNRMAEEYAVNSHCLLDDDAQALALAESLARGEPLAEPGPYVVVEVLRSRAGLR